ncbi:MAG TPA: MarR family transcriptional regulator [Solirubrobacteraceae bacterium]|nr:MarR family transcriptional regulator [Solirubrobacteraceae bacterium]
MLFGDSNHPGQLQRANMTTRNGQLPPAEYRKAAALRAGLRHFSQASEHALQRHGLTPERYELLLAIKAADGGQERATVSQLTTELGVAQSSVTQLVRRVEDAGLLRREVSASDARVRYLRLTTQGERQLAKAVADLKEERARLATVLSQL